MQDSATVEINLEKFPFNILKYVLPVLCTGLIGFISWSALTLSKVQAQQVTTESHVEIQKEKLETEAKTLNIRFDDMEKRLDSLEVRIDKRFDRLEDKIDKVLK